MRRSHVRFSTCCLLGLFVSLSAEADRPGATQAKITVVIFNYVEVPEDTLTEAQAYARNVFQRAGVRIEWSDPSRQAKRTMSPALAMRIVPNSMIAGWARNGDHAGYALVPADGEVGAIAGAYYERIAELARRFECKRALLLGYVIAHELGHLLLGANSHSNMGIMAYPIERDDVLLAAQNRLHFTRSQAQRIRRRIRSLGG